MGQKKEIKKAEKQAAKRIAKQMEADRTQSDDKLLAQAVAAFDNQHGTDSVKPVDIVNDGEAMEAQYIETSTRAIATEYFGTTPTTDMSIAMSLLLTTINRLENDPRVCDFIIQAIQQVKNGGTGGSYQLKGDNDE